MWVPTALLPRFGVDWWAADDCQLTARWQIDAHESELHLVVDAEGHLRSGVFQRWGDPDRTGTFGLHPCGGEVTAYSTLRGASIPSAGRAGWLYGTDAGRRASSSATRSPRWNSSFRVISVPTARATSRSPKPRPTTRAETGLASSPVQALIPEPAALLLAS
jgi:hypothetical protein